MPALSQVVLGLRQSGIRKIMNLALGMPDVIRLEVGEPLFQTPRHIVEAANRAAQEGFTKYTANAGIPSLRQAIARRVSKDYGVKVAPENVGVTVGGVGAVSGSVRAVVDPGDEVLIPDPGWPNYEMIILCAGARPRRYALAPEDGFLPTISSLERVFTPRTKAIIINSPSNPLGTVFPGELIRELVEFARRHDIFLISDEVYERIVFDGQHVSACSFDTDGRVITVFSVSKTYAMTGWRVGYVVALEPVVRQLAKLQEAYVSCAPSVSQKAAEAALTGPQDCVGIMGRTYMENLAIARNVLDSQGVRYHVPKGAFYLWIDVNCRDSMQFARQLLTEQQVAVAPGIAFGPSGQRFIRVSLASAGDSIREGLRRLIRFLGVG